MKKLGIIIYLISKQSVRKIYIFREAIKETDDDAFVDSVAEILRKVKRKNQVSKLANQKLGMMRHLFILLDCSEYMLSPDLKPSRLLCTLKVRTIIKIYEVGSVRYNM